MDNLPRLLLIENSISTAATSLSLLLKKYNELYEITSTTSIEKAREYLHADSFDLILLDTPLDCDGIIALRKFIKLIPVLVIAEFDNENDGIIMMLQGIDGVAIRDTDDNFSSRLSVTIEKILARKQKENSYNLVPQAQGTSSIPTDNLQRLVAGLTHDLNNVLSPILSFSKMLLDEAEKTDPNYELLEDINTSAVRAKNIVRQLAIFRRRDAVEYTKLDLGAVLTNIKKALQSTLSDTITLDMHIGSPLPPLLGDIARIEQAVMYLSLHVQELLQHDGSISLSVRQTQIDRKNTIDPKAPDGTYLLLESTGTPTAEIERENTRPVLENHIIHKDQDQEDAVAAGLELVRSIVTQHNGFLNLTKNENKINITLYFPTSGEPLSHMTAGISDNTVKKEAGRLILLVESNIRLQSIITYILQQKGYTVIHADNLKDAYEIACSDKHQVNLLLADTEIVDPGSNQISTALVKRNKGVKVLYMARQNHLKNSTDPNMLSEEQTIYKPFALNVLTEQIRNLLESRF